MSVAAVSSSLLESGMCTGISFLTLLPGILLGGHSEFIQVFLESPQNPDQDEGLGVSLTAEFGN